MFSYFGVRFLFRAPIFDAIFCFVAITKRGEALKHFVIIINGIQPLTIITTRSILDVAAALDPPLDLSFTT